jgi:uncharacterized protein YbjT (DUF2867 family)
MRKLLLAGASGTLGKHLAQELNKRGFWIRAIARHPDKLHALPIDEVITADLLDRNSLTGVCEGVDSVFSCAGASMNVADFRDKRSFNEVDYQGNLNLLNEARTPSVKKFGYVSLAFAEQLLGTEYADAHEQFINALKSSGIDYVVIRPTGFFGFHLEILRLAMRGRGIMIGSGDCKTNPIHEADVAKVCVDSLDSMQNEIIVGGPDTYTRKEITAMAFDVLNKPPRVIHLSPSVVRILALPLRLINRRLYALMDFGIAVSQIDVMAPVHGSHHLREYFENAAKRIAQV